ncbi:histone-like nucleoid-structuring protein Lsr2 [Actinokineospora cianjurensis]|uniref:Lsr2 protein n=1 Tax=Actinokineospora cianjurensis TaxID=585224 RepID=A0A421B261_9PSEU|nr:Lsr2 family protein [Actinokineospora cianjurensis]RLK58351.1 Lsr2 protein [Actinokineospora cianjurensis]
MAQKTIIQLVDDLDNLASEDVTTVEFGLDGVRYEIDLNGRNAERLREQFAGFVSTARRTGGRVKRSSATSAKPTSEGRGREQTAAIREWARRCGHDVSDRGRIPTAIIDAFEKAHTTKPTRAARRRAADA